MIPFAPFENLIYETDGAVCTITLNRPEKKNALSAQLVNELIFALETARDDAALRVIVLTGAGGVFSSGGDLSQMAGGGTGGEGGIPYRGGFVELNLAFRSVGKPVIAKVRRYALAGALGVVCACQFAIAEETATFALPEINRGIFPMMIMANIFRAVPLRKGLELVLLGETIDAKEACAIGLLNRAVPAEKLDDEVRALALKLARKPPAVVRLGLEAFYRSSDMVFEEALPYLNEALMKCFGTDDAREGLMAFLEKREAKFTGR